MKSHRVLLLEDDALLGALLSSWIEEKMKWDVVKVCQRAQEFFELCAAQAPDLVLLDLALPDINGITVARTLQKSCPQTKIIILSSYTDPYWVQQVIDLKLPGYMSKTSPLTELEDAMRRVMAGEIVYDKDILAALDRLKDPDAFHKILTPRELMVLSHVAEGKADQQIAETLGISKHTVAVHRRNIRQKLHGHNDRDLIHYARVWGIVPASEGPLAD